MSTTIKSSITLGKEYTDKNTGFIGIAVCISKWEYGCIRITLQPQTDKGILPESQTFDEPALIKDGKKRKDPGGPRPHPTRPPSPARP